MEHGGAQQFFKVDAEAPESGPVVAEGSDMAADGKNAAEEQVYMRRAEEYMPIANILRIMRQVLPSHAKIADDAKETIQECVTEFISYVTSEANVICNRDCRKTVTADDIISAMRGLGFDNYVELLTVFLQNYRAQERGMPNRLGGGSSSGRSGGGGSSAGADFGYFGSYGYK